MIPKKKPEFNASANVEEMIQAISEYYGESYDDRDESISEHISLRQTAEHFGITVMKARKLLITAGRYSTETSRAVQELAAHGLNIAEIMKKTGLGRSSVHSYIPYNKTIYNLPDISLEAERQRQYRVRKKNKDLSEEEIEQKLWDQLIYLQGCIFTTARGLNFTYQIRGGEMFISRKEKSITRATVLQAYHRVVELEGIVAGPKKIGTFGASYLYPIFQRIGLIQQSM